jgi:hypothetical protein
MTKALSVVAALIALGLAGPAWAQSKPAKVVLITEAEAGLPSLPDSALAMRAGVTRGPKILMVSPTANASLKSPFPLRLKFETFGGAKIDPASIKVTYLKNPSVDLTARIGPITQGDGIDVAEAEVPPGTHHIRVNVKDSEGRAGSANFALKVTP